MAREVLVTRTIKSKWAQVMCVNNHTMQVETHEVLIPRLMTKERPMLTYAQSTLGDKFSVVKVVEVKETEALYGMSEEEFVTHAQVLPARTNKGDK